MIVAVREEKKLPSQDNTRESPEKPVEVVGCVSISEIKSVDATVQLAQNSFLKTAGFWYLMNGYNYLTSQLFATGGEII